MDCGKDEIKWQLQKAYEHEFPYKMSTLKLELAYPTLPLSYV
jgi:hypothetical protein